MQIHQEYQSELNGEWTVSALSPSHVLPCFILSQQCSSMQPDKGHYLKMKGGQKRRTTCMTEP
jgi:hypothetical protein